MEQPESTRPWVGMVRTTGEFLPLWSLTYKAKSFLSRQALPWKHPETSWT